MVSSGLSVATVALNVAGAATDAIPIAKQILNSAAHISAAAERIQKKREAMYLLVEKADMYATQIDQAVAGCEIDASLQRRLGHLYSVFLKIETVVNDKADSRSPALVRVWRNMITNPNRAEALVAELDREIQLFHILTGIQLSADVKYDGQFRRLRDCDIEKLNVIHKRETDEEVIVWASARVKHQLMAIRYVEPQPTAERNEVTTSKASSRSWDAYLENIKRVSTVHGSHPHVVQLYGRHVRGLEAVFRAGTFPLSDYLNDMSVKEGDQENLAIKLLTLVYKILDASRHLVDVHGLRWVGSTAIVDENGEPRIGLFDDIVRADCVRPPLHISITFYFNILVWFNSPCSEETGVEHVHDSTLHAIITAQLHDDNQTNSLQRVWDIIRHERLRVAYSSYIFPIITGNLSLTQEMIARAQRYFDINTNREDPDLDRPSILDFLRHVLVGGANISRTRVSFWRLHGAQYAIEVEACRHDDKRIRYDQFLIYIPTACPLLSAVTRAVGLPEDFEHSWSDYSAVNIYQQSKDDGENTKKGNEVGAARDGSVGDHGERGGSEEEDKDLETAEGRIDSDVAED